VRVFCLLLALAAVQGLALISEQVSSITVQEPLQPVPAQEAKVEDVPAPVLVSCSGADCSTQAPADASQSIELNPASAVDNQPAELNPAPNQPTELNPAIEAEAAPASSLEDKISAVESIKTDATKIVEKALVAAVADCNTNTPSSSTIASSTTDVALVQ